MNFEQIMSLIRQMLLLLSGGLVTKGHIDASTQQMIIGGIVALMTGGWAFYTRRNTGLIASAAALPSVVSITSTSPTAVAEISNVVAPK